MSENKTAVNENEVINLTTADNGTFESAMSRLEEIVRKLESGNVQLNESLSLFEEGVGLVRVCNERLDNVERRIKILTKQDDGTLAEEDFKVE